MAFPNGKHLGIWAALLAEVLILTILTSSFGGPHLFDSTFLTWSNISQVIRALSFIAIMAVGQAVVIISGGVDLSVGLVIGVAGVVTADLVKVALGVVDRVPVCASVGVARWCANG